MTVITIEPTKSIIPDKNSVIKVCAYCRVSSSSDEQLHSFAAQVDYYQSITKKHHNWRLVDVYADKGISGRIREKRDEFNRMIQDADYGVFDMIICKSISRFARDVITTLEICRELKNKGIDVFFEKENIHTLSLRDETYFSTLATLAESESRNISLNTQWSIRKRMKGGTWKASYYPYGYKSIGDRIVKVEEEKENVLFIFNSFINGMTTQSIADELNRKGIVNRRNNKWKALNIVRIITNPIYQGTIVTQKTFTVEDQPYVRRVNNGQLPKYHYIENHEPYIDENMAKKISSILSLRRTQKSLEKGTNKYLNRYPLSGIISCNECGTNLKRVKIKKDSDKYYFAYACIGHLQDNGSCSFIRVNEEDIYTTFTKVINKWISHECMLRNYLNDIQMIAKEIDRSKINSLIDQMEYYYEQIEIAHQRYEKNIYDSDFYNEIIDMILQNIKEVRHEYMQLLYQYDISKEIANTKSIIKIIESMEIDYTFNSLLFETIVELVVMMDKNTIKFIFVNGMEIVERIGE